MLKLLRKIKFIHVFWVFLYFFLFALLLRGGFNYLDPDLGWHLKVGQEIAQTKTIPHLNHYNYSFTGNWVDHEWLSNFFVYEIYQNFGYPSLVIVFALIIITVLIFLNLFSQRVFPNKKINFLIAFFQVFGLIASLPHFGVRIQELALLFLFLTLLTIYYYQQTRDGRLLIGLIPLFYLWACLHASFLLGFFVLFSWLGVKIVEKVLINVWSDKYLDSSEILKNKTIFIFLGFASLAFLSTLATPYKLELYSFLGGYSNTIYFSYIQEWLSQFSYPFNYWQLTYLSLIAVALIIYSYDVYRRERKLNLWLIFLPIVFFILSFKSRRHLPLLFICSFIFSIEVYSSALNSSLKKLNLWLKAYLLSCLFMAFALQVIQINFILNPFQEFKRDYPVEALNFLASKPEYSQLRIFNDYVWGGYLIWMNPNIKPFIDGRLPQVNFKGATFLEEYLNFSKKDSNRDAKFAEYDIRLVLIKAQDEVVKAKKWEKLFFGIKDEELNSRNYLREYLMNSFSWRLIYNDPSAVIYLKVD